MPYNPGVQSRVGELLGAGIASAGQSIGAGFEAMARRREKAADDAKVVNAMRKILPMITDDDGKKIFDEAAIAQSSGPGLFQALSSFVTLKSAKDRAKQEAAQATQNQNWYNLQKQSIEHAQLNQDAAAMEDQETGARMSRMAAAAIPAPMEPGVQGPPTPPVLAYANAYADMLRNSRGLGAKAISNLVQFGQALAPAEPQVMDRTGQVQEANGVKMLWTSPRSVSHVPEMTIKNGVPISTTLQHTYYPDGTETPFALADNNTLHAVPHKPNWDDVDRDAQGKATDIGVLQAIWWKLGLLMKGQKVPEVRAKSSTVPSAPSFIWDPARGLVPVTPNPAP